MAVLEKVWKFRTNYSVAPSSALDLSRNHLWFIKAWLLGQILSNTGEDLSAFAGKWVCRGSSDGVEGDLDGVDRWGNIYDGSKIVRAASGTAHSWIVLRSPEVNGSTWEMCIDFASSTDASYHVYWSKAAFTGGSVTNRPTSTDEWGPSSTAASNRTLNDGTSSASRLHAGLAADGTFYVAASKNGSLIFHAMTWFWPTAEAQPMDLYPVWTGHQYNAAVRGAWRHGMVGDAELNGDTTPSATVAITAGRRGDGALNPNHCPTTLTAPIGAALMSSTSTINSADFLSGRRLDMPMHVLYWESASVWHYRGRLVDLAMSDSVVGVGDVDVTDGLVTSMVVGNTWVPTNIAPLL